MLAQNPNQLFGRFFVTGQLGVCRIDVEFADRSGVPGALDGDDPVGRDSARQFPPRADDRVQTDGWINRQFVRRRQDRIVRTKEFNAGRQMM